MIKKFSIESMVLSAICVADLISTIFLVDYHGYTEGNPLMSYYLAHGVICFCLVKFVLFAFPVIIFEYARRKRPVFTKYALRACIGVYLFAYAANYIQVNGLPDQSADRIADAPPAITASMASAK